jgi:hypothetical protein
MVHQIKARVSDSVIKEVSKLCHLKKMTITELIRQSLISYIKTNVSPKESEAVLRELSLASALSNAREEMYHLYFLKNVTKRIMTISYFDRWSHGKVDMKKIEAILNRAMAVYKSFPDKVKELVKDDLIFMQKFRKEDFIVQYMHTMGGQFNVADKRRF